MSPQLQRLSGEILNLISTFLKHGLVTPEEIGTVLIIDKKTENDQANYTRIQRFLLDSDVFSEKCGFEITDQDAYETMCSELATELLEKFVMVPIVESG
jgi:hypothetical protein